MIIFRYLSRDIILHTLAVTCVLLLIVMSGRFVKYLADAAAGRLAVDVLFTLIAYRMPGFLELVVPLGFFIAVLLAYGRLYVDSEMTVLSACGLSPRQLLLLTMIPTALMAALVAVLSLWVSPLGAQKTEELINQQRQRSEFDMLQAGRFQAISQGRLMTYVQELSNNRRRLNHVFVAEMDPSPDPGAGPERLSLIIAEYGEQVMHPDYGQRYLELRQGYRYEGLPGSADYRVTRFSRYGQHMATDTSVGYRHRTDAMSTAYLLQHPEPLSHQATLQWRFSLPLLVFIVALLAVPLSATNPRQGRYLKMLPAIIVFMTYLGVLSTARGMIEAGSWPVWPGLWVVHLPYLALALVLLNWNNGVLWYRRRRAARAAHA